MAELTLAEIEEAKRQEALTRALQNSIRSYFHDFESALSRIRGIPDPQRIAQELLNRTPRLTGTLTRGVEKAMRRGIFQMIEQFGPDAILDPQTLAVRRSIEAASHINDTTAKQLIRWRQRALDRPDSWAKRTLRELFDIYSKSRSELIAAHETHIGYETGRQASAYSMTTQGRPLQKNWNNQGDDKVTDDCKANSAAGWITWGGTFPGGTKHSPQHHRCRCWNRYREWQPGEQIPSARQTQRQFRSPAP